MERSRIFTIAAWAIGALFLGAVAAVGFATGGFGLGELSQPQEEAFDQDYRYSWNVDEDPVTGLNISWFHGPVELKVGDGNVIYVTERSSGELEEGEQLELSSSGGVLTIKWNSQLLALDLLDTRSKALAVQVPAQVAAQLKELRCTTVSGTVTARGFSAEELEFASDSGSLELYDLRGEEASFQAGSGALLLQGAQIAGELRADTGSGTLELRDVAAGRAELSSVSAGCGTRGGRTSSPRHHLRRGGGRPGGLPPAGPDDLGVWGPHPGPAGGRRVRGCLFQHVRGVPVGLPCQRGPGPQRPGPVRRRPVPSWNSPPLRAAWWWPGADAPAKTEKRGGAGCTAPS